jgi:hypothetical protein
MRVERRYTCEGCEHNGFYLDDEIINTLGIKEEAMYYDEEIRQNASKILGFEVKRDEAYEGSCNKGEAQGDGCWLFYCHECGADVDCVVVARC